LAQVGFERIGTPVLDGTGRDDIGVAGEAEQGADGATPCPQVAYLSEWHEFAGEAGRFQPLRNKLEAAGVLRGDGATADQVAQEVQRGIVGTRLASSKLGIYHCLKVSGPTF